MAKESDQQQRAGAKTLKRFSIASFLNTPVFVIVPAWSLSRPRGSICAHAPTYADDGTVSCDPVFTAETGRISISGMIAVFRIDFGGFAFVGCPWKRSRRLIGLISLQLDEISCASNLSLLETSVALISRDLSSR